MRGAERTEGDDGICAARKPRYGVNFSRFYHFLAAHVRKNSRKTFRHHAFSRSWRPHHNQIMTTGCCNLKGTFYRILPLYIGIINVKLLYMTEKLRTRVHL